MEMRNGHGDPASLPRLAAELVPLRPDVLIAVGTGETKALQAATNDILIVFMMSSDPVGMGIVDSIAHPGRNTTGTSISPQILWGKRLELIAELIGHWPTKIPWLANAGNVANEAEDGREIRRRIASSVRDFLRDYVEAELAQKKAITLSVIQKYPQYLYLQEGVDDFVQGLKPNGSNEEAIYIEMSQHRYRRQRRFNVNVRSSTPGKLRRRVQLCAHQRTQLRSADDDGCGDCRLRTASMDNSSEAQNC